MEPARNTRFSYLAIILLVAIVGALVFSYREESHESDRLAAAMRNIHQERERLQAEARALRARVAELERRLQVARES